MSVIPLVSTELVGSDGQVHGYKIIWPNMTTGDTGQPFANIDLADKSVQVFGTFGGGTLFVEGSNDDQADWAVLNNPQGVPLAYTVPAMLEVTEISQFIRPRAVGVSSVSVAMVARTIAHTGITI